MEVVACARAVDDGPVVGIVVDDDEGRPPIRGAMPYPERPTRFFFSVPVEEAVAGGAAPGPGAGRKVGRSLTMRRQARRASSAREEGMPPRTLPVRRERVSLGGGGEKKKGGEERETHLSNASPLVRSFPPPRGSR